jgi:hypothetical protein
MDTPLPQAQQDLLDLDIAEAAALARQSQAEAGLALLQVGLERAQSARREGFDWANVSAGVKMDLARFW